MEMDSGSVQCAGGHLGQHRHICAFFNGIDEEHRVLRSFFKEGFERGDKAFHIVDPELREEHLRRLAEAGIEVDRAMSTGQLEIRRWQDAYLRDGRFDQDAMLALLEEVLQSGAAAGFPLTRFVSRVEAGLIDKAGVESWLEYETRVNYVVPKYDDPVICVYDLVEVQRGHGDGHAADAPGPDRGRGTAGESVLRSSRPVPARDPGEAPIRTSALIASP